MADPIPTDAPAIAYSIPHAAKMLDLPETKLWQAIKDQALRSFKAGRSRRVTHAALCEYVRKLERHSGQMP